MAKIYFEHETSLSAEEIKKNADNLIEDSLEEFEKDVSNLQKNWEENILVFSFNAKGFLISGRMTVGDNLIKIEVKIPLVAFLFKKEIKRRLQEKARELFH